MGDPIHLTEPADSQCPYPGLRAFMPGEREWYFGREAHVDAMLSRLETTRFLAVVGPSGSGKSSLVFAGLIPALREGQLVGMRRTLDGAPAAWNVIDFHPGNDPLGELAAAIVKHAPGPPQPHLAGYVRAVLRAGEQGLPEALRIAGLLDGKRETLVYADQFEEVFRFGENSSRAAQEDAQRFVRLLVAAAQPADLRLHLLLSMRSEFIGNCELFSGLPELVSTSQFLTPRLNRKQREESLADPARAMGWEIAPDALNALLNDCGNSPDQLPLAQHVQRRMWQRAARDSRTVLTLDDYQQEGGIRQSIAEHGKAILDHLPQPDGPEVARILFMALCDQRDEGPLVRRLSSSAEVEAIAGEKRRALVPGVIEAFGGDDPGFIRGNADSLDVRHEAVLRQWPIIGEWRAREADSAGWLRDLSQAARQYHDSGANPDDLWRANHLRQAQAWYVREEPSVALALRHGIKDWPQAEAFLQASNAAFVARELAQAEEEREARARQKRDTRNLLILIGGIALICLVIGLTMTFLWRERQRSAAAAEQVSSDRLKLMQKIGTAVSPTVDIGEAAIAAAEYQVSQLGGAIQLAAVSALPPDETALRAYTTARDRADSAVEAIQVLSESIQQAARDTSDAELKTLAAKLAAETLSVQARRKAMQHNDGTWEIIKTSTETRLQKVEQTLADLSGSPMPISASDRERAVATATADLSALRGIEAAADVLGFHADDFSPFITRLTGLEKTLADARANNKSTASAILLPVWTPLPDYEPTNAFPPLIHGGRVNRVRFAPNYPPDEPLIVTACEDGNVCFWERDGSPHGWFKGKDAVNDVAFNPLGNIVAAAGNDAAIRFLVWAGQPEAHTFDADAVKVVTFAGRGDAITDVEFSHGGERLASASADRTVCVFDTKTRRMLYRSSPALPGIVTSVAFHPKDNLVVSGCDDGGVREHTIDSPGVRLLGKMDAPARSPEYSADGAYVIAASGDHTARVWRDADAEEVLKVNQPAPVTQATFRPVPGQRGGYVFVTTSTDGSVRLVRMLEAPVPPDAVPAGQQTGASATFVPMPKVSVLEPHHPGAVYSAKWSVDGMWLATVGAGEALLWQWTDDGLTPRLQIAGLDRGTSHVEFSADAGLLVTYGGDNRAYIWDLSKLPRPTPPPPARLDQSEREPRQEPRSRPRK